MADIHKLTENWIHLGLGAKASSLKPFTGMEWYGEYGAAHSSDGNEGRLVSMHTFTESWDVWEVHPNGHEVVICTAGEMTLIQEIDGDEICVTIGAGEYAINPPGVWHTADIRNTATAIFITAGQGTDGRPR